MKSPLTKYSYLWITLGLFAFSFVGHWLFAWQAYVQEQAAHNMEPEISEYIIETSRDTLENWQSEFLQLAWQVGGLALFLFVGSPQSKESSDRAEEKLDHILKSLEPKKAEKIIDDLEKKYPKG